MGDLSIYLSLEESRGGEAAARDGGILHTYKYISRQKSLKSSAGKDYGDEPSFSYHLCM